MDSFYAHREIAQFEMEQLGLKNYRLPELPEAFKSLPDAATIYAARKIAKSAYVDLNARLEDKFMTLVKRVCDGQNSKGNPPLSDIKIMDNQIFATAECQVEGVKQLVPMQFRKVRGEWRFDGKNEIIWFDRQRLEAIIQNRR